MTIKLQKYIAQHSQFSRRKAEELIEKKQVTVNGEIAHRGQRIDPETVKIAVQNKNIDQHTEKKVYFLLNKPPGYVSTTHDEHDRPTVRDLIKGVKTRIYPVGRLDIESEGLLIMTNDGDLTQKLTHPRSKVPKTYHVNIDRPPTRKAIEHLRKGVKLKEGFTQPALVSVLPSNDRGVWLEMTITEGKNRQIRRMMERVGYEVLQLLRISVGELELENLNPGKYRELTEKEVIALKKNTSATSHLQP